MCLVGGARRKLFTCTKNAVFTAYLAVFLRFFCSFVSSGIMLYGHDPIYYKVNKNFISVLYLCLNNQYLLLEPKPNIKSKKGFEGTKHTSLLLLVC